MLFIIIGIYYNKIMDNNNKIEIKHSAFIILPIIAFIISVIGELLCFLEGIPLSGRSWMPVFWLITMLAIPVIAIIFFVVGLIFSLIVDKICKPKLFINKFWIPILIIVVSTPFWTPFIISPVLYPLGGQINTYMENQKYHRSTEVVPQEPIRPKREYHCESKVTQDGIVKFCVGDPENQ